MFRLAPELPVALWMVTPVPVRLTVPVPPSVKLPAIGIVTNVRNAGTIDRYGASL